MWYFTWVLGIGLACCFAIFNAMWLEMNESDAAKKEDKTPDVTSP